MHTVNRNTTHFDLVLQTGTRTRIEKPLSLTFIGETNIIFESDFDSKGMYSGHAYSPADEID
jgi:hypothetical protein